MKEKGQEGLKAPMGKEHWEEKQPQSKTCNLKYAESEMGNPKEMTKNSDALAGYVKKNKEKR
jgi:hypothetical protein